MPNANALRGWGAQLAHLRENTALSGGKVVERLTLLGIRVDRRTIYAYEAGRIAAPDAGVIWGLARIYGIDVDDLIASLVSSRTGLPLANARAKGSSKERVTVSMPERDLLLQLRNLPHENRQACFDFVAFETGRVGKIKRGL